MKKYLAIILCAVMVLSLVACGGGGSSSTTEETDNGSSTTTDSGTTDAPSSEDPIVIGVIAPVTGDRAESGTSIWLAIDIAIRDINANGGVLGRQVEIILEDSKGDSKEAVELAKKMVDNPDICAVIGPMTSAEAIACSPIFDEGGLVELASVASNSTYAVMSDWSFTLAGRQTAEMPYFVEHVVDSYAATDSVGIIYINDDWGVSSIESLVPSCEEAGITVTATESFAAGEKDFTAMLTKIRQTNPDSLILVTQAPEGSLIMNQVSTMGWDVNTLGVGAMYSEQVIQLAGDAANGLVVPSCVFLSPDDPPTWSFATTFEEEAGFKPTTHGPLSYDAAVVLCAAIEQAGSTDREAIRDALANISGVQGIAGTYEFTEDGDIIREYRVLEIVDGEWKAMTDYAVASNIG